jgi:hypothetical protein
MADNDDQDFKNKGFVDNTGLEILHPDPNLGDDVKLHPSPNYGGKMAAVAEKGGNQVCWNCFKLLGGRFTDLMMGTAIVRFCDSRKCHIAVAKQNDKRERLELAGRIIPQ